MPPFLITKLRFQGFPTQPKKHAPGCNLAPMVSVSEYKFFSPFKEKQQEWLYAGYFDVNIAAFSFHKRTGTVGHVRLKMTLQNTITVIVNSAELPSVTIRGGLLTYNCSVWGHIPHWRKCQPNWWHLATGAHVLEGVFTLPLTYDSHFDLHPNVPNRRAEIKR